MANLTGVLIFGAIITGILFILDVGTLILSAIRIKEARCSLIFANMITFTIAQLAGFIYYLAGATDGDVTDGTYTKNQDPPRILMYLFYLTSITLLLFVWVNRIKTTFQETKWAYSAKLMKTIYIVISIVPFLQFGIIISAITVTVIQKDPTPADNPIYKMMMAFTALYLLFVISLSLFLSYLFIQRCIVLIKFKLEIELSGTNDGNNNLVYKLLNIQTKLTILVIVAIASTFCTVILNLIFGTVLTAVGVHLSALWTQIDIFLNYYCIALILKQNENMYSKACKCCICCFNKMRSGIKAQDSGNNENNKPKVQVASISGHLSAVSTENNGSTAATPTPLTDQSKTDPSKTEPSKTEPSKTDQTQTI